MTTATRQPPHHRSLYCVKRFGCQRPECRTRAADYARSRYRKVGYGTWQPYTDAEPVRAHIAALRAAGVAASIIADKSGVHLATVGRILWGKQGQRVVARLRTESAQAILAIRAEDCDIPNSARVDATGTRRRLQALVAAGWSFTALGPEIGIHPRPLGDMARAGQVTAGNARKVKAAYRRLVLTTPAKSGVQPQARSLAKRVAAREGWVPPAAWDDIDDPACKPDLGTEDTVNRDELAEYRRHEIAHLASFGVPEHEIAARLGMSPHYVHDLIRDRIGEAA